MDIFQRSQASSVLAFAARVMLAMGIGYKDAGSAGRAFIDSEGPSGTWALSVLLVLWFGGSLAGAEAAEIARLIVTTGSTRILATLNLFREQLLPFVQAAYRASEASGLAAAGVYFRAALEQIGATTIASAIKSPSVAEVRAQILAQLPLPDDVQEMFKTAMSGVLITTVSRPGRDTADAATSMRAAGRPIGRAVGVPLKGSPNPGVGRLLTGAKGVVIREKREEMSAPEPPAPATQTPVVMPNVREVPPVQGSRGDRFDRADLKVPPPKPPVLDPSERLLAHLYVKGWSPEDIDRLAKGPKA